MTEADLTPKAPLVREDEHPQFERTMKARHLIMLSLGGVIGTGLFFNTGFVIGQTGAFGTVVAYLIGALVVYLVMLSMGELCVAMPQTGSFHLYATTFIGPRTGFTVAWLYWVTCTVSVGTSLTGAGLAMQYWFPNVDVWIWCLFYCLLILAMNVFTTKFFAEGEFIFSLIKVITIQVFIIAGGLAVFGVIPLSDGSSAPYFSNLTEGGLFPKGLLPLLTTMIAVNFAFSGTELIGVAAGETQNPEKVIPMAVRTTVVRLVLFFIGTIVILAALLPMEEASILKSPFVTVFERIGIPYAADLFNFVILTAVISAANSNLYAAGRMGLEAHEARPSGQRHHALHARRLARSLHLGLRRRYGLRGPHRHRRLLRRRRLDCHQRRAHRLSQAAQGRRQVRLRPRLALAALSRRARPRDHPLLGRLHRASLRPRAATRALLRRSLRRSLHDPLSRHRTPPRRPPRGRTPRRSRQALTP